MPYFRDPNEDRDENNQPQGLRLSSSSEEGSPLVGLEGSNKQNPTGSNFQNLDNYLSTNDAQGFGDKVESKVQGDISQGRNLVDQNVGQVKNQIQQGGVVADRSEIERAVANPVSADKNQYQSWTNAQYNGPKSLQDNQAAAGAISGAVSNAQTKAKLTGSEAGRFSLLDSYFGRPNYSFGEKSLDNLLVQRGGGLDTNNLQNQASQLGAYANQQGGEIGNAAAQRAGQVEQTRKTARDAIGLTDNGTISGGAIGGLTNNIDTRTKFYNDAVTRDFDALKDDVTDDTVRGETLAMLGLESGANLYDLDLDNYLNSAPLSVGKEAIATPEDYERYLALTNLAGVDPTYLTAATKDQAGKVTNQSLVNKDKFQQDLKSADLSYQNDLADASDRLNRARQDQARLSQLVASYTPARGRMVYTPEGESYFEAADPMSNQGVDWEYAQNMQRLADLNAMIPQMQSTLQGVQKRSDRRIQAGPVATYQQPVYTPPPAGSNTQSTDPQAPNYYPGNAQAEADLEEWINNSFGNAYTSYR